MDDSPRPRVSWWRPLGWLVALLALGFVVRWLWQLDHQVWLQLRHLQPLWLVGSLLVFQIWFLLRYAAWEFIVKRHGVESQRHQTLRSWIVSELMRYAPGNIWSFAARYRSSVTSGATASGAVQAMAIEAFSLVSGAGLMSSLLYHPEKFWWVAMAIVVAFPVAVPMVLKLVSRIKKLSTTPTISMTESLGLLLWYGLVWVVFGIASALLYRGFPDVPTVSFAWLIGLNVAAWLLGYLSIVTPMGLGVREVAFVKLASDSIPNAIGSLVAIVSRLWFVLSELVFLGLVLLWSWRKR